MAPRQKKFDRDEVLYKAMITFRDQGYDATSMQDLVERMGINRFSLYSTFENKHKLFVEALKMYYDLVAVPFFGRLKGCDSGIKRIEAVLLELVSRIKEGVSSNGCLLSNTVAELGAIPDNRTREILNAYLRLLEADFRAAIDTAIKLGEVAPDTNSGTRAKVLATYTTGLLGVAKVMSEREARESVRAMVATIG